MADEKQLEILNAGTWNGWSGVQRWNNWRKRSPKAQVDLTGADLSEADLSGTYLARADLRGANLSRGDLSHANLRGANLSGANLSGTNLSGANLVRANLSRADLSKADLSDAGLIGADFDGTNLSRANLRGANLSGANLSGAVLVETVLGNVNLSSVIGLDSCLHDGPSILDHRTLMRSGPLPLPFMRGCGLPDSLIDYLPSLLGVSIEFYSCFISYSTQDQDFANRLHADLQGKGVRCWFARHNVQGGRKLHEQIDEAIRVYDKLLLILSDDSMKSEWVKTEIAHARQKELAGTGRVLFPISLVPFDKIKAWKNFDADTGKDSAREIREYFIPDFSQWKTDHDAYTGALERLLKDLRAEKAMGA